VGCPPGRTSAAAEWKTRRPRCPVRRAPPGGWRC
jgi:hypothetical protein